VIAVRRTDEALGRTGLQALLLHQPDHALPAHAFIMVLLQISVNPRTPVALIARGEGRPTEDPQPPIPLPARRRWPLLPCVEAAARHTQTPTQHTERMVPLLRGDELESHCRSFAKKAAAFRRISRSSRRIRTSFRRRASSSRSTVVRPVFPFVRSARARLTHSRSAVSVNRDRGRPRPRSCPRPAPAGPPGL
jgi:hypothetical protein